MGHGLNLALGLGPVLYHYPGDERIYQIANYLFAIVYVAIATPGSLFH